MKCRNRRRQFIVTDDESNSGSQVKRFDLSQVPGGLAKNTGPDGGQKGAFFADFPRIAR
jgi:hypothetical protein